MPSFSSTLLSDLTALAVIGAFCASVACGMLWLDRAAESLAAVRQTSQLAGSDGLPRFF